METKWLEDFIALAETRSFSRAAQQRNVTQPAFSRRIQALEAWLGVDLVDRTAYPTRLTSAGETFYPEAIDMLERVGQARANLRGRGKRGEDVIDFALPHALSLTFFPGWLSSVQTHLGPLNTRLSALNVHDAVLRLTEGGCDLLMIYHHPRHPVQLDEDRYDMLLLGTETLRPYAKADARGRPLFTLPGRPGVPVPFLSYTQNAYLGRMVDLILADARSALHLQKRYETDMAEGLKAMAIEGHGIAFLPGGAVAAEVRRKRLVCVSEQHVLTIEIRLYRDRPDRLKPGQHRPSRVRVAQLWDHLSEQPGQTMQKKHRSMRK